MGTLLKGGVLELLRFTKSVPLEATGSIYYLPCFGASPRLSQWTSQAQGLVREWE